ncbi:MAG: TniQ family protein [Sulfuritalea sp.]|nr:TniQ family protein [Sulfuritalea sp.]
MHADTAHLPSANASRSPSELLPGLSGDFWPIHPHRLDDELLSFWIVRTAHANGLKLQTFTTLALGLGATLWNRDIDRSASEELLNRLSAQTGSSAGELRDGMLSGYETVLFERHNVNGNTNWILPLGIYHRTRRGFGIQFCPLCLFADPVPYFRRKWRLAFVTICDQHNCLLHDRCPACQAPVIYFRNDLGRRKDYKLTSHTLCWQCGFDLCRAPAYSPPAPDGLSIVALRSLITFHDLGWWFQGDATMPYGHLYFDALHHLAMLLSSARGRRLLDFIEKETGWRALGCGQLKRERFEQRSVRVRHELLVAALWLLEDWPDRFVRASLDGKLSQSRILRGEALPFWFESEVRLNLGAGSASPTSEEARQASDHLATTGRVLSTAAVGRLVGSRHARAAKAYAKGKPASMTNAEFRRAIEKLDVEIKGLRPRSPKRLILQRDRTIVRLMRITGWSARKLLSLTVSDATALASRPKATRALPGEVAGFLLAYLRDTRRYLAGDDSGDALFIGWHSAGIGEKNWGLRISRVRRKR